MAQLGGNFDANKVDPSTPRGDVIEAGKYPMQIISSTMKPNSAGTGRYLELEHEVIDGPRKGARVWNTLNLENPSAKAVEIAERDLSAICHAVGVLNVSDSEQLHWKPFLGTVKVKPAEGKYPAKNEMGGYEPIGNRAAVAGAPNRDTAGRPPAAATQSGAAGRPWAQNRA